MSMPLFHPCRRVTASALALFCATAIAQPVTPPDPLDAQAPLPAAAPPPSAFDGYVRSHDEPPPVLWSQANAAVAEAGGWRALAREASAPAAPNLPPVHSHGAHEEHAP